MTCRDLYLAQNITKAPLFRLTNALEYEKWIMHYFGAQLPERPTQQCTSKSIEFTMLDKQLYLIRCNLNV